MSRSYRKPYYGNPDGSGKWKTQANRSIRRYQEIFSIQSDQCYVVDGAYYKRLNDVWDSPMECKHSYWDVPKLRRK